MRGVGYRVVGKSPPLLMLSDPMIADGDAAYWLGILSEKDETYATELARERSHKRRMHEAQVALSAEREQQIKASRESAIGRLRSLLLKAIRQHKRRPRS